VRVRNRIVLACLLTALLFSRVGTTEEASSLVGHWELIAQPYDLTIEFKQAGTYVALTAMGVMTGHWELESAHQLATWSSENLPRQRSRVSIQGDTLTITTAEGTELVHQRIEIGEQ